MDDQQRVNDQQRVDERQQMDEPRQDGRQSERKRGADERRRALDRAYELATGFLETLDHRPVWPPATYEEMLTAFGGELPDTGSDPVEVLEDLARRASPGISGIAGGRFFGFVIGGELPAALGADWLTSVWDQNAGLNSVAPAAAAAEIVAGQWIVEALGLPRGTAVGLATGAMMANYTCLSAARHAMLGRTGWDVNARGLFNAPRIRVFVGADRHDTIDRAVRFLGLGQDAVHVVPSDSEGRLETGALAKALESGTGPAVVCLQAGEVHTGAFDPFAEAIQVARAHDAWVHVDGAFGLWAAASPSLRHLTNGVAQADSWATDAHKTLNVPYDCGVAMVRDPSALVAGFGVEADYLIGTPGDPIERVPELSRRARGFPVWAALQSLGREGLAALVEQLCARATQMAAGLAQIPGVTVVNDVAYTQVLSSFGDDARTAEVGRRLLSEGTAVFTPATWHGQAVQRCSVSSWATTPGDVDKTIEAVRRVVADL
jgi:glutamate/tyrosine decarboxylase-like PLP-dependent enzyme